MQYPMNINEFDALILQVLHPLKYYDKIFYLNFFFFQYQVIRFIKTIFYQLQDLTRLSAKNDKNVTIFQLSCL